MKYKIYIFMLVYLLLLISCQKKESIQLTKGEELFLQEIKKNKESLSKNKHIIFILNQSLCQPCEDKIRSLYSSNNLKNYNKTFVIPKNQNPIDNYFINNYISIDKTMLLRYGVLKANGTVAVLDNGKCLMIDPIDINFLPELENKIMELTKPN